MAYKVIENFADVQHNNRIHYKGDAFPSGDYDVDDERISELLEKNLIANEMKSDTAKRKSEPKGKTKES